MDTVVLARELVRALRGRRGQMALSRALGFRTNVVYCWEAGRRAPSASDLFRLASAVDRDPLTALARFMGVARANDDAPPAPPLDAAGVRTLLDGWAANLRVSELARTLGVHRNTVTRWLDGSTEPRLPEFLAFIEATTGRLLDFITLFADAAQLPTAQAALSDLAAQRRAAYELPWSHAVLRCLELRAYRQLPRHDGRWIARQLGLTSPEVDAAIGALITAKIIRLRAKHYEAHRVLTVDTRADAAGNWALKHHWASVAAARVQRRPDPHQGLFSYNLFAVSRAGFRRLSQMQLEHFEAVRRVVAADRDPECVALMNLQLFQLGGQ